MSITDETTAAETTIESGRESAKDTLPDDLDFGGEVVAYSDRRAAPIMTHRLSWSRRSSTAMC